MAYGSRFCDLFDGVELLLMHRRGKQGLLADCSSASHAASNYIFLASKIVLLLAVLSTEHARETQKLS